MVSKNWSKRFPGIKNRAYMANCSQGPLSIDVEKALADYMRGWLEKGNPWDDWMEVVGDATSKFAQLVHAKKEEVCPTYSVSTALSSVMSALDPSKRNKIVISELDFPATTAVVVAQTRRGFQIQTVVEKNGMTTLDDYEKSIDDQTLLVVVNEVCSLNGFRQDAKAIAEIAHAKGALVFVDSYQTAGNSVIDAKKMDADFLASGSQKYLLGIAGSAYLYVQDELVKSLEPIFTGWFSQRDPFKFARVRTEYLDDANRFQMGTWSVACHYAARAGMQIILEVGDAVVQDHVSQLTRYLLGRLEEYGLAPLNTFPDTNRGAFVSIRTPNAHEMEKALRKRRIHASARGDGVRFALHFFNKKEDIDKGLEAFKAISGDLHKSTAETGIVH